MLKRQSHDIDPAFVGTDEFVEQVPIAGENRRDHLCFIPEVGAGGHGLCDPTLRLLEGGKVEWLHDFAL
jgi:hypothetical protein